MHYQEQFFAGERSLFGLQNATIEDTTFGEGESPLKHSQNIKLQKTIFQWKYPLWYSHHINVNQSMFETMARSGIWYTDHITVTNSTIQAPKLFRRCHDVTLQQDYFANADETLWNCQAIQLKNIQARGDYFGMNSQQIHIDHFNLVGNYAFDGASNLTIKNSHLISKDAFWNCKNVTIENSFINGEYLGWNTENLTLINCTVESNQGFCYIKNLKLEHCRLLHTDLAFEYCENIDAQIDSKIDSIKNPLSGRIEAPAIDQIILEPTKIDPHKTQVILTKSAARGTANV